MPKGHSHSSTKPAVILVGHGAVPSDAPGALIAELKSLEARRKAAGGPPSARETELDAKIRNWPRTPATDPYQAGLEAVGRALQTRLSSHLVLLAYNEFCSPTLEAAVEAAVRQGARAVTVITTMYTRGGVHSETEIPELVASLKKIHPGVELRYVWPFSLDAVSGMLAQEVERISR